MNSISYAAAAAVLAIGCSTSEIDPPSDSKSSSDTDPTKTQDDDGIEPIADEGGNGAGTGSGSGSELPTNNPNGPKATPPPGFEFAVNSTCVKNYRQNFPYALVVNATTGVVKLTGTANVDSLFITATASGDIITLSESLAIAPVEISCIKKFEVVLDAGDDTIELNLPQSAYMFAPVDGFHIDGGEGTKDKISFTGLVSGLTTSYSSGPEGSTLNVSREGKTTTIVAKALEVTAM